MTMKAECAWCGKELGLRPGPDGQTTHGICDDCRKKLLAGAKIMAWTRVGTEKRNGKSVHHRAG